MPADEAEPVERLDLHVHSTWSSGFCEPAELVRWASLRDVRALAITDHHRVEAIGEALPQTGRYGVALLPAIELDCTAGQQRVDLLGYWIDPATPALQAFLRQWPSGMDQFLNDDTAMSALAATCGTHIGLPRLGDLAGGRPPGLIHLFTLLVESGWAPTIGAAFRRFSELRLMGTLPRGERRYAPVQEGAAAIRAAGGLVALAHPGLVRVAHGGDRDEQLVRTLAVDGVVDAIETPYGGYWTHGDELNRRYATLAAELGVPTSAGSDYHAYPSSDVQIGVEAPLGTLARLRDARRA